MSEIIINADGTTTIVCGAGTASGYIARKVREATIPATHADNGSELTPEIMPDSSTVAVEVASAEMKTHPWLLPKRRAERLGEFRNARNVKLSILDTEYVRADEGSHPSGKTKAQIANEKQALRDLPPVAEAHLATLTNTDDIDAYLPDELV